jgi:hypothetical protein
MHWSRLFRFCTAGKMHIRQDRYCILLIPNLIDQPRLRIVSRASSSVMPFPLSTTLLSVHATSLYSAIWKRNSEAKYSRRWRSCSRESMSSLVKSPGVDGTGRLALDRETGSDNKRQCWLYLRMIPRISILLATDHAW